MNKAKKQVKAPKENDTSMNKSLTRKDEVKKGDGKKDQAKNKSVPKVTK